MSSRPSKEPGEDVAASRPTGMREGNCYTSGSLEAFAFYIGTFKLCAHRSPEDALTMQILIQEVWTGTWYPTCPAFPRARFCWCW